MRSSSGVQLSNHSPMDIDTEMPQNDESYLASLERWEDECCMNNKDFMEGLNISSRATCQDPTHIQKKQIYMNQQKRKRKGQFVPHGQLTGTYKMPKWTDANDPMTILGKSSCPISLWPTVLESVMEAGRTVKSSVTITNGKLDGVCLDKYVHPNKFLFVTAHTAVSNIIPIGDMENLESSWAAQRYTLYWRPKSPKVILLCELHSNTSPSFVNKNCPRMRNDVLPQYKGPRNAVLHVYNILYGENDCSTTPFFPNDGSVQFWKMLGTLAYGYED